MAVLNGRPMVIAAVPAAKNFREITITVAVDRVTIFPKTNLRSKSMPIETKKKLVNKSLNGKIFPRALSLNSDSDTIRPAMNAPNASERPKVEVNHVAPRATITIPSKKSC